MQLSLSYRGRRQRRRSSHPHPAAPAGRRGAPFDLARSRGEQGVNLKLARIVGGQETLGLWVRRFVQEVVRYLLRPSGGVCGANTEKRCTKKDG